MFTPFNDAFCCRALENMHAPRPPYLLIVCSAAVLCCGLSLSYFCGCVFLFIFFLVSVQANIGSTITNILISNIIIQIPEGALLTCTPPLPPPTSSYLSGRRRRSRQERDLHLKLRACEEASQESLLTRPPSSSFPPRPPSFAPVASPPLFFPARPRSPRVHATSIT